jgi:hypothetical protein
MLLREIKAVYCENHTELINKNTALHIVNTPGISN